MKMNERKSQRNTRAPHSAGGIGGTPSWLVFTMPGRNFTFARLVSFREDGINRGQAIDTFSLRINLARLELNLAPLRQFHRFQRAKHALFKNCMNGLYHWQPYGAELPRSIPAAVVNRADAERTWIFLFRYPGSVQ
jgi:hypothetical protein